MSLQCVSIGGGMLPKQMNFGCGNIIANGYVNIDISISRNVYQHTKENKEWIYEGEWDNPHQFPANHFDLIEAVDVMEHIHPDMIGNLLYCFACSMRRDGILNITVPDFESMARSLIDNSKNDLDLKWLKKFRKIELDWMAPYLHGGIGHQSIWTPTIAKYRIEQERFTIMRIKSIHDSLYIKAKRN